MKVQSARGAYAHTVSRWGSELDDVERTMRYINAEGAVLRFSRVSVDRDKSQEGGNSDDPRRAESGWAQLRRLVAL